MPSLAQDQIEAELLAILRQVPMPDGLAEAVDAALATSIVAEPKSRQASLRVIDARLERLRDLYELGDMSRDDYRTKTEALRAERKTVETSRPQPVFVRQTTLLCTLVDDWDYLSPEERKALIGDIFEEIRADESGIEDFLPREVWKQYMRAVIPEDLKEVPTERKTGLYVPNVETGRLVQDERGWLRLAS
jgi:hypothetical protein